ncbi:DUF5694 domain-containing protein [Chitinophaga sp. Cy-1792]|uniref:DUF5694 domain-containing protein n=1 Tax=Chitinophaga sp. Cy-1792 TaxID=2608339 RepID=UPI001422329F|nr:DUF5694 domain-containing protein [Chitinophaga sp. Cy-1792]NIG57588.1 hypothetical protein [Chitinophaga sp. Cy-1792]
MKRYLLTLVAMLSLATLVQAQQPKKEKEVLLIGVFHFNNPGADLVKTKSFDVMSDKAQHELETITDQIKKFKPTKIFVEWDYDDQHSLDTLYDLYLKDTYFKYVQDKYPKSNFYKQNEIFQLSFRAGKKAGLNKIHAIDVAIDWPYDSVMTAMKKAGQTDLQAEIDNVIKQHGEKDNALMQKLSLTQLLLEYNTMKSRNENLGLYLTTFNKAGAVNDFAGAYSTAAWYKRNLYMYSLVQKLTERNDERVMVVLGAGHAALFKHFIDLDDNYKVVELSDVLKKK